jgi:hypothetical protein
MHEIAIVSMILFVVSVICMMVAISLLAHKDHHLRRWRKQLLFKKTAQRHARAWWITSVLLFFYTLAGLWLWHNL